MYASAVSTVILLFIVISQKKVHCIKTLSRGDWISSLGFGLLNPLAYYLVLFKAYDLLPAQQAQIINYTWAITLSLLSIPLLGQRVGARQWLAIGLSYIGVLVIATKGDPLSLHFENPLGVGLALFSTVLWSLYWILNTRDKRDPIFGLFLNFLCALPFIVLYVLCTEGFRPVSYGGILGGIYIGIFEMGVSFVLWLKAMKYTNNTARIANLIFIAPFASLVFIHFLVGEEIFHSTLVGLALVMGGLTIQSLSKSS